MIESILDDNGKGVLTAELHRFFVANGCEPKCHICNHVIKVGDGLHLKPFFVKTTKPWKEGNFYEVPQVAEPGDEDTLTSSIDVMICLRCSDSNRKLPESEADRLLETAHEHGLIEPTADKPPGAGTIRPFRDYSTSTPGVSPRYGRSGGCMIVRLPGKEPKIVP